MEIRSERQEEEKVRDIWRRRSERQGGEKVRDREGEGERQKER